MPFRARKGVESESLKKMQQQSTILPLTKSAQSFTSFHDCFFRSRKAKTQETSAHEMPLHKDNNNNLFLTKILRDSD